MPYDSEEVTVLVPSMEPLPRLMMQGGGGAGPLDSPGGAGVCGAACSDTSSGPVPALDSSEITMVPVPNLSSASLAAAAAVAAAEAAQRALTQRGTAPPLEAVRRRRRLLFTQAPAECSEDAIKAWFSQFGAVELVQVYNNSDVSAQPLGGTSSSSSASSTGLVVMASHEAAAVALAAAQGGTPLPAPLSALRLSWLLQPDDSAAPAAAAAADGTTAAPALVASANRTVFFAKVPPTALASEVELLFGSFGKLAEVNLFRAWAGAKHSKGCGLIMYANRAHAAAAIAQLHGKYVFPGSDCPMVVEWIDLKKQRPMTVPPERPPLGAAPDAKLLLSNVPISITEDALVATLTQFGRLVQVALSPDPAGPCASGCVWFTSKAAADSLLARSKAEPVWLHDARSQHDLALAVKRARRVTAGGCSGGTATRVNVGSAYSNTSFSNNALMSSSSNSSSSLLPFMQLASMQAAAAHHSQELHSGSAQRLGALGGGGGYAHDALGLLASSSVMRLLPMHNANNGLLGGGGGLCESVLEYGCDSSGLGMGMPGHLQPSLAAQMAAQFSAGMSLPPQHAQYHHHQQQQHLQQQQQRQINSQMMCMPPSMVSGHSGQHCLSSPANIQSLDEFEGSFSMLSLRGSGNNTTSSGSHAHVAAHHHLLGGGGSGHLGNGLMSPQPAPLQHHQMAGARNGGGGMLWQQQHQPSPQPHHHQQQHQQFAAGAGAAPASGAQPSSLAVPIESYEVQVIAEHLGLFASHSGARVTISSLPGAGLAVMLSGQPEQIAAAQSLLAAARGK